MRIEGLSWEKPYISHLNFTLAMARKTKNFPTMVSSPWRETPKNPTILQLAWKKSLDRDALKRGKV